MYDLRPQYLPFEITPEEVRSSSGEKVLLTIIIIIIDTSEYSYRRRNDIRSGRARNGSLLEIFYHQPAVGIISLQCCCPTGTSPSKRKSNTLEQWEHPQKEKRKNHSFGGMSIGQPSLNWNCRRRPVHNCKFKRPTSTDEISPRR